MARLSGPDAQNTPVEWRPIEAVPILTRRALYDLVWADPVRTVAATFGVSDVWLKKLCAGANVPVPERGYWAKLQPGKSAVRVKLPARDPGMAETVSIGKAAYKWRWDPEAELAEALPDPPVFEEPIEAVSVRVVERVGKVATVRDLDAPWPGIRKLLQEDDRRREKQAGRGWVSRWDAPRFDSPFEQRRLWVLNSLALAFARSGAKLEVRGREARDLSVLVGTQRLAFRLDHPSAKPSIHGEWSTRAGPVDTLKLQIEAPSVGLGTPRAWTDGDGGKLEIRLADIVVTFLVAGEVHYRAAQVSHHAWLIKRRAQNEAELARRVAEAERDRRERQLKEEHERREHLFAQARDWRTAQDIRAFVRDVVSERRQEPMTRPGPLDPWRAWALAEADMIDPVRRGLEPWRRQDGDRADEAECKSCQWCECGVGCRCECDCEP